MRFKLTTGFLIVSVAIFVVSAVVITRSAERNEESNMVKLISEQSNKDAQVIAGMLTDILDSPDAGAGSGAASTPGSSYTGIAMSTFLANSDIVRLSLIDVEGSLIWSTAADASSSIDSSDDAFRGAVLGQTATALKKDVRLRELSGGPASSDLIATYIPLVDISTNEPVQIIEVTRDVTEVLGARIASTRNSNFLTVFSTLGGSFFVLFGVVLSADIVIGRSRRRSLMQERALAEEKIVAKSLESENQQLKQLDEERNRFLSMVSHELRTPLATMMGFTDILSKRLEGEAREKNLRHLVTMRRNGEHLDSLIEDMLEVTRIQSGRFEIEKDGFVVESLLEQVVESGSILLRSRGQTLNILRLDTDLELHGDRRRIMQVLLNLLSNASKYSPESSAITLGVEQADGSLKLWVRDEGEGIPREEFDRLFARFYRRDDEVTRSQSGLGLGLSIVKAVVDAHHGTVEVNSIVGVGTTMTVTLPGSRKIAPQVSLARSGSTLELHRWRDLRTVPEGIRAAS